MGDAEIVTLLISKMDDLKDDIKSVEEKIDRQSEKLNSFEIKATEVLAVHDCDITALKLKVDILDKEAAKSSNPISKFINSDLMTIIFRALFLGLLTILTAFGTIKSDKAKTIFDSISPPAISDTLKPHDRMK